MIKIRAVFNYHSALWPHAQENDVCEVTPQILEQLRADKPNGFEVIKEAAYDALGTRNNGQADDFDKGDDGHDAKEDESWEAVSPKAPEAPKEKGRKKTKAGKG